MNDTMSLMDFVNAAMAHIRQVEPAQLQQMIDANDALLLVDVREASEHEQGHIAGAVVVPRGILEAAADPAYPKHLPVLSSARERPIVLYCASGGRSALAAHTLQQMGFKNVVSLAGGVVRWAQEQRPLERQARYV